MDIKKEATKNLKKHIDNSAWEPKKPAKPPISFNKDKFFSDTHWHQRWEVFKGVFSPGTNPVLLLCDWLNIPLDLRGKRILDIGAWNGCFSFECERRGASEVIAFSPENPNDVGFYRIKDAIDSKIVRYKQGSVYDLNTYISGPTYFSL